MKKKSLLTVTLFVLISALSFGQAKEEKSDVLSPTIQDDIYNAFVESMEKSSPAPLDKIIKSLSEYNVKAKRSLVNYWIGYSYFYRVVFYMQGTDKKGYMDSAEKGIDALNSIKQKSAEDYALLSRIQGLYMKYAGMKAVFIFKSMNKNAETALKMDPDNVRVNFVMANNDYFTPKAYGGGKKAEKYFLKAISLPEKNANNTYLPTWGKDEAYEYLIRFYMDNGRTEDAKKYAKTARELYPKSYMIYQLYTQLFSK